MQSFNSVNIKVIDIRLMLSMKAKSCVIFAQSLIVRILIFPTDPLQKN